MGFDGVWVHDALLGRRTTAAYCPINVLSAIAARTERLKLCTGILTPQVRNPVPDRQSVGDALRALRGTRHHGGRDGGGNADAHQA